MLLSRNALSFSKVEGKYDDEEFGQMDKSQLAVAIAWQKLNIKILVNENLEHRKLH